MFDSIQAWLNLDTLTLLLAVYSALVSTYLVASTHRRNRRRIHVELASNVPDPGQPGGPRVLVARAVNRGHREVTLNSMGYLLPDGKQAVFIDPHGTVQLPHTLAAGTECSCWTAQRTWAEGLRTNGYTGTIQIQGFYDSTTGDTYTSPPLAFDIDAALQTEG